MAMFGDANDLARGIAHSQNGSATTNRESCRRARRGIRGLTGRWPRSFCRSRGLLRPDGAENASLPASRTFSYRCLAAVALFSPLTSDGARDRTTATTSRAATAGAPGCDGSYGIAAIRSASPDFSASAASRTRWCPDTAHAVFAIAVRAHRDVERLRAQMRDLAEKIDRRLRHRRSRARRSPAHMPHIDFRSAAGAFRRARDLARCDAAQVLLPSFAEVAVAHVVLVDVRENADRQIAVRIDGERVDAAAAFVELPASRLRRTAGWRMIARQPPPLAKRARRSSRSSSTISDGVSRTASGLDEQSMRGLIIASNLNSTPRSSAICCISRNLVLVDRDAPRS